VTTVSEALAMATALHERGELARAEAIYGQIVAAEPRHADAWHRLGVLAHQLGRNADAAEAILRAITLNDSQPAYHNHLGAVYAALAEIEKSEASFRRALALAPDDAQVHYNLAALLSLRARHGEAIEHYRRAIALNPRMAEAHFNLGNLLREQGDWAQAENCYAAAAAARPGYVKAMASQAAAQTRQGKLEEAKGVWRRVIQAAPTHLEAHVRLGSLLQSQGLTEEAIAELRTAVDLQGGNLEAQNNLGCAYRGVGQLELAEQCFRRALAVDADCFAARVNLGSLLHTTKAYAEAGDHLERAVALDPASFDARQCLGIVRQSQQRYDEAVEHYRRALELEKDSAEGLANLGSCLRQQGKIEEAIGYARRAIALDPTQHGAQSTLGQCLQIQGHFAEALASYDRALAIKPDHADYHYFRATLWLTTGDFDRGWPEYEWRLKTVNGTAEHPAPRWKGEPLNDEKIVVYAEWGLGDTLHFARYIPLVRRRGGNVFFQAHAGLIPLLEESGFEQVVPLGARDAHHYRWQIPLLSLPSVFRTGRDKIPCAVPYLQARPALVEQWRDRLRDLAGLRIGIFWQGRMAWAADPRSIPLAEFEPLARVAGVALVSLQKQDTASQLRDLGGRFEVLSFGEELDASGGAFMDTAAIMKNLDLVVTCDTSTAHLAGALGVPVWVALPRASEWRWMTDREDTPWYPTMRLFRQRHGGGWKEVFDRMADRLTGLAAAQAKR
jgi:tetratricopeptide (TPR) repeat protein